MPIRGTAIFFAIGAAILMTQICAADIACLYFSNFEERLFGVGESVIANGGYAI
jgi:hypothetical protein